MSVTHSVSDVRTGTADLADEYSRARHRILGHSFGWCAAMVAQESCDWDPQVKIAQDVGSWKFQKVTVACEKISSCQSGRRGSPRPNGEKFRESIIQE